jgi:DNA-binding LacI/PurR family transcriptional regulator
MAATLKDVALRAGVSRSAVSRTFTKGASVSAKTRAKVEAAAEALGYAPNALASSLTTGRTKLIGLIANNFHNPLILEVIDLFTRGLQERGLRPLLVNLTEATDAAATLHLLRQYSVDGVIVASSTLPSSLAESFHTAGLAVVHAFGRAVTGSQVPVAGIDNAACGRIAAEALAARGYRRIGLLGGPRQASSTQDRARGFLEALAGLPSITVAESYADAYSFDAGREAMARLLAGRPMEAYFCGDDLLAIGAMCAIAEAGLGVPRDIGIIGLNDMEMARWPSIGLTTISQPVDLIIKAAIEMIVEAIGSPRKTPDIRIFPCHLVERGTLRAVPGVGP